MGPDLNEGELGRDTRGPIGKDSPRVHYHGTWGNGYDEDEWRERRRISLVRREIERVLGGGFDRGVGLGVGN